MIDYTMRIVQLLEFEVIRMKGYEVKVLWVYRVRNLSGCRVMS